MRALLAAAGFVAVVAAASASAQATSGIKGLVYRRPCGPAVLNQQRKPFDAHVRVYSTAGALLRDVRSGSDGLYTIGLAPGRYVVKAGPPSRPGTIAFSKFHATVTVATGAFTRVNIGYDTGCR